MTAPSHPPVQPVSVTSVRRRYVITLLAQITQMGLGAITASVVPKALGPVAYGNYNFLLNTASTIRNVLDLGTQQSFFTFSSQKHHSGPLTKIYGLWVVLQLGISLGVITMANLLGFLPRLWPHQLVGNIYLISLLEWLLFVSLSLRQLADSKGITVKAQIITVVISLLNATGLVGLALMKSLNFYSYVALAYFTALVGSVSLGIFIFLYHGGISWVGRLKGEIVGYVQRWWKYASPLIIYSVYSAFLGYVETYIIQRYYGSAEQAYFALANRWSVLVLVFTSSAVTIYWRELASQLAAKDIQRAARTYHRFNQLLFSMSVILACWLCLNARTLVPLVVGSDYHPAIPVMMLMAFYPVQQTIGQLSGAAYFASERTTQYRNLGMWLSVPALVLTYILLAPRSAPVPGLNLGAFGAALKMVGFGLISVQLYDWLNCRYFGLSYIRVLMEKLRFALAVGFFGLLVFKGLGNQIHAMLNLNGFKLISFTSVIYFVVIGAILYAYPQFVGLKTGEISALRKTLIKRLDDL